VEGIINKPSCLSFPNAAFRFSLRARCEQQGCSLPTECGQSRNKFCSETDEEVAKSQVIFYWFPNETGYKLLNLLVSTSGKEKLTSPHWKNLISLNTGNTEKGPVFF